jgi:hypothetical protein
VSAALPSPPATKALDPDLFPCLSLRHAVYAILWHFGLESAVDFPSVRVEKYGGSSQRLAVRGQYDGLGPDKLPGLGTADDEGVGIYPRLGACVEVGIVGIAPRMGHPIKNDWERIADRVPLRVDASERDL